jgi:hypothetical protein
MYRVYRRYMGYRGFRGYTVSIEVAHGSHAPTETIPAMQLPSKASFKIRDLLTGLYRAIDIQEQNPHRACPGASIGVISNSNGQVHHAVSIEVPNRSYAMTELIIIIQRPGKVSFRIRDLLVTLDEIWDIGRDSCWCDCIG